MVKKEIEFIDGIFIAKDEKTFQHLLSKGFGQKIGNLFTYDTFEALYLLEKGKISIFDKKGNELELNQIIKKKKININSYLVYKNLKKKDYNVKTGIKYGSTFRIYEKGIKVGEDHSIWLVDIFKETSKLSLKDFLAKTRIANTTKKKILLAIIDSEKNITYIESNWKKI